MLVRKVRGEQVSEGLVEKILEAAGNFQAYEIYVVSGEARMRALAAATIQLRLDCAGSNGTGDLHPCGAL